MPATHEENSPKDAFFGAESAGGVKDSGPFPVAGKKFFLVGVGGMGMLPLALFLVEGGGEVEGWDDGLTPRSERLLRDAGVVLKNPEFSSISCDVFVYSSAVRPSHPAFQQLEEGHSLRLRRGELLARLAADRKLIAVVGSHGKTTTTAMIAWIAKEIGEELDFLIGGLPEGGLPPASNRRSPFLLAEVDESDGTIEGFYPQVTLFVNFDWDHADRYESRDDMMAAWRRIAERTSGAVIVPRGNSGFIETLKGARLIEFSESSEGFRETNWEAARTVLKEVFDQDPASEPVETFPGVWRRQTIHWKDDEFAVLEDYAHHPAEVEALLEWIARGSFPKPLRVFFQPHRFSRTTRFASEFVQVLKGLDTVGLHSVYAAGEKSTDSPLDRICQGLEAAGVAVERIGSMRDFTGFGGQGKPFGTYAFVGAGDAHQWAALLAARYRAGSSISALWALAAEQFGEEVVEADADLGSLTTLRIGGKARLLGVPHSEATLRWLLRTASFLEVPVAFIGNGSNVLVADEGFEGLVVHFKGSPWDDIHVSPDGEKIVAGAGASLAALARFSASNGRSGFEFMEGIPGTVGGSLRMNAGSMGSWMENVVERVDGMDAFGRPVSIFAEELDFGYRSCPRLEAVCIIRAVFSGQKRENPDVVRSRMREFSSRRRKSQPGGASAGCMFRNPEGDSAGRLIEAAGLKGSRIRGAEISGKHANFVLPDRDARSEDVLDLIEMIQASVHDRFGICLQPEVKFLGPGSRGSWVASIHSEETDE